MKAKLLKKLRKRYVIECRNGKFRVPHFNYFEPKEVWLCRSWNSDFSKCLEAVRWLILSDAQSYKTPKKTINPFK